jgi:hypothetical protein
VELKADDSIICDRFILFAVMKMELIGPRLHLSKKMTVNLKPDLPELIAG